MSVNARIVALAVALVPHAALAAPAPDPLELCVPQAQGVPGPQPKTPEWWNPAAPGREQRWTGAVRVDESQSVTGGTAMSWVRSVWDRPTQTMFVHFAVRSDPSLDYALDHVFVALTDASGAPALYIQLDPMNGCADPVTGALDAGCTGEGEAIATGTGGGVKYATPDPVVAGKWSGVSATLTAPGFSVDRPWVQVASRTISGRTVYDWDVQVAIRIPVGPSGESGATAKIFATTMVQAGRAGVAGSRNLQFPAFCNPNPVLPASCSLTGTTEDDWADSVPGDLARWELLRTSASCGGVSLAAEHAGSNYNMFSSVLDGQPYAFPGYEIPKTSGARLRAGIRNGSGRQLASGEVRAEFRIANWGATWASYEDATWDLIGGANLSGTLDDGRYAFMPGQGTLESANFVPGAAYAADHQCVHIKLTATPAPGQSLRFANDSIYKNMQLVPGSTFRKSAEINLVGLEPRDQERTVVLLVDTRNMPGYDDCWPMGDNHERYFQDRFGCFRKGSESTPPRMATAEDQWGVYSPLELPTYVVHAFLDTGETIGPEATPVALPFSGFGYHVQHQGRADGWEHALDGAEHVATAPFNLYELRMKPRFVHTVVTTIRALDETTTPCPTDDSSPTPEGCDRPAIPPPRDVAPPKPVEHECKGGCCCVNTKNSPGPAHAAVFGLMLLGLRRGRRRR